jgi:hypothetical protein
MDGGYSMRTTLFAIVTLVFSFLLSGCYSKVTLDDVLGNYKIRYPYGTEELLLANDGTYIQTILIDGETTSKTNKGKWEFWEKESEVVLNEAMIVDDGFGKIKPHYWENIPIAWNLNARKSFGKVSLLINPDQGFAFKKLIKSKNVL